MKLELGIELIAKISVLGKEIVGVKLLRRLPIVGKSLTFII